MGNVSIRLALGPILQEKAFSYNITEQISLADLMNEWGSQYAPEVLKQLFDPQTEYIAGSILILLNSRSVKSDDPRKTVISPGDDVFITRILIGG